MANPIRVNRTHFNDLVNDNAKLSGAAFTGDVSVTGNLDVTGTTTSVINLDITDSLIGLNNGLVASNTNDSGILIGRGQDKNAFMGWDESAEKFIVGATTATASSTGNLPITTGTLVANLEGNVTGALTGNAATATTATTAAACSGNAATATIAFDCSGNAATATKLSTVATNDIVQLTASQTLTNKTLTSPVFTTPALGTPVSGDLTSCTFPTLNQNTSGSSGSCTGNAATATSALTVTQAAQAAITSVGTLTGLTMADEGDIAVNATTGTKIGTATTQKLGFFNANPVAQPAAAAQAAVTSQSLSDTAAGTYTQAHITKIQTELNDVTALANEMRTVLVNLGLMRGSA